MPEPHLSPRDVADDLRNKIVGGEYAPGARLPGRNVLMREYGVNADGATTAIRLLKLDGLAYSIAGSGTFVRSPRPVLRSSRVRLLKGQRDAGLGTFSTDADRGGWTVRSETDVFTTAAPEDVADALDVEHGTSVIVRDRIMFADDEPVQLATSYLPGDLSTIPGLTEVDSGPGGIYRRLEDAGYQFSTFHETVTIRRLSDHDATRLRVAPGSPAFGIVRVARSGDTQGSGRPLEVNYITAVGDRWELSYLIPAE